MKSWQIARGLLMRGTKMPIKILCTREFQNSISDSVLSVLEGQAKAIGIDPFYTFQNNAIYGKNGTEFTFKGLRNNINSIKSFEGADIVWNEEAQTTSQKSLDVLLPTIRKPGSQIINSFNPDKDTDPIFEQFVTRHDPQNSYLCKVNYLDNPWIGQDFIDLAEKTKRNDYDAYEHIYLGECWTRSDAQVLNGKWRIDEFTRPEGVTPYFGADWGFSQDPTTLICCYIVGNTLYIEHEFYQVGLDIINIPNAFRRIPFADRYTIRADNARPETINHVRNAGLDIIPASKWSGSVEDGVSFLRNFDEIIIHARCKNIAQEAKLYSYKTDKLTGDILPVIIDKHNHGWDAVRYALQPLIQRNGGGVVFI